MGKWSVAPARLYHLLDTEVERFEETLGFRVRFYGKRRGLPTRGKVLDKRYCTGPWCIGRVGDAKLESFRTIGVEL